MIKTSDEIRAYRPEKRKCYLPGEKELDMYRIYSQQSCILECLRNYTAYVCECCPIHSYSNNFRICGPASKKCLDDAKVEFLEIDIFSDSDENDNHCNCLPACTTLEYDAETSQVDWDWRKTMIITDAEFDGYKYTDYHQSRLIVYFKEMQFMTSERHELYGTVDFLANCGGLLGLFCGFSFISFIEIIYYLTLRIVCNLKKFGRKIWFGEPELLKNKDEEGNEQ